MLEHWNELHNLAARGELTVQRAASIQFNPSRNVVEVKTCAKCGLALPPGLACRFHVNGVGVLCGTCYRGDALRCDNCKPASIQPTALPTHDAKFTTDYICNLLSCEFRSDDAVAAVNHVLASGHEVLIHGSIQAVPVTVLEIEEHDA